jgi:hypothetical protein
VFSVNVRIVIVVDVKLIVSLSIVPSAELVNVTVTFRVVCPKPLEPVRASRMFTGNEPAASVTADCSAGLSVNVVDPLLPASEIALWVPDGRVRDRRCELLHR